MAMGIKFRARVIVDVKEGPQKVAGENVLVLARGKQRHAEEVETGREHTNNLMPLCAEPGEHASLVGEKSRDSEIEEDADLASQTAMPESGGNIGDVAVVSVQSSSRETIIESEDSSVVYVRGTSSVAVEVGGNNHQSRHVVEGATDCNGSHSTEGSRRSSSTEGEEEQSSYASFPSEGAEGSSSEVSSGYSSGNWSSSTDGSSGAQHERLSGQEKKVSSSRAFGQGRKREVFFSMVEGDFQHFSGVWTIQRVRAWFYVIIDHVYYTWMSHHNVHEMNRDDQLNCLRLTKKGCPGGCHE